jgi:phosphotransferase system HPr (HPr) family protein
MTTGNETTLKVISRKIPMRNPFGLHLQPASELSRISLTHDVQIVLRTDKGHADVSSIFELLILGVMAGDIVELSAHGHGAAGALDAICDFLQAHNDAAITGTAPGGDGFESCAA